MTLRHLNEEWYVIVVDQTDDDDARHLWHEGKAILHGPGIEASAAWYLFGKHGFGVGFQLGRNGSESDLGLNLYMGRLASLWLRIRTPWTKWARISQEQDPKNWYLARHTGLCIHPHEGCLISGELEALEHHHSTSDPWWRSWSITRTTIVGRSRGQSAPGKTGVARIPLPEGVYEGTWQENTTTYWHLRAPGTWLDRIFGPRQHRYVDMKIEGGIPIEGKGENSWDCGMDGLFGCGGATVEDAIGNAVKSVLRGRSQYGGPHNLTRPMTVAEAGGARA